MARKTLRKIRGGAKQTLTGELVVNNLLIGIGQHDGYKSPTEDRYSVMPIGETAVLLGVYDGHTGSAAAEIGSKSIPAAIYAPIAEDLKILEDPPKLEAILRDAVIAVDSLFKSDASLNIGGSGSTVSLALVTPTHIIAANSGDSPILYFTSGGEVLFHSVDHDCENAEELARIRALGGDCGPRQDGVNAVKRQDGIPGLMMTRSIGDFDYKPPVIPDPQTYIMERKPDTYLVICSDSFTERFATPQRNRIKNLATPADMVKAFSSKFKSIAKLQLGVHAAIEEQVNMFKMGGGFYGDNTTLVAVKFPVAAGGKKRKTRRRKRKV